MREQSIVGNYYRMAPRERLNAIVFHFDCFPAIIRDYEMELEDWILTGWALARQESLGELGVRIQCGDPSSSPTFNRAEAEIHAEKIVRDRSLDESCRNLADRDEIARGLLELQLMQKEYGRIKIKIRKLPEDERDLLKKYVSRVERTAELAQELQITQRAVKKKLYRIRLKLYAGYVESLRTYDDESILMLGI